MVAHSMEELQAQMLTRLTKSMNVVSDKVLGDMYEQTGDFYTGGTPVMYERTGALGDTPRTTAPNITGDSVSFEAYLDTNHAYSTGKKPSMATVLELANTGSYPGYRSPVGKTGFWDKALENMEKTFNDVMQKTFG